MFLQNDGEFVPDYTASRPKKRWNFSNVSSFFKTRKFFGEYEESVLDHTAATATAAEAK
jgi:hypothetical protein